MLLREYSQHSDKHHPGQGIVQLRQLSYLSQPHEKLHCNRPGRHPELKLQRLKLFQSLLVCPVFKVADGEYRLDIVLRQP